MSEHTPGPWTYYNSQGGRIYNNWRIIDSRKLCIAKIEELPGGESELANARLIALSPELLDVLEEVMRVFKFEDVAKWLGEAHRPTYDKAMAVIAKAKGEEK